MSIADELLKMKSLLDAGLITQAEFDAQKNQLLGVQNAQPDQSPTEITSRTDPSPQNTTDEIDHQRQELASDSPVTRTQTEPSHFGQSAPPPPVGFTGRAAPPTSEATAVHRSESTEAPSDEQSDVATTADPPDNSLEDLQGDYEVELDDSANQQLESNTKSIEVHQHEDTERGIPDVAKEDESTESSVTNSPDLDDVQNEVEDESQSHSETLEQPDTENHQPSLNSISEDKSVEIQQEITDPPEQANGSDLPPPVPPQEIETSHDGDADITSAPPQPPALQHPSDSAPTNEKSQAPSTQHASRNRSMVLVGVLVIAVAFMGGLLVNRSNQEAPATQPEQSSAATTQPEQISSTTQSEAETDTVNPVPPSSPASTAPQTENTEAETTRQSIAPSSQPTTVPPDPESPETTNASTETFSPSLPWIVRSASGSDQGSTVIIASSAVDNWHHGNCHSYTSDSTVSDPDGVVKVEWLMIYIEGQIPTGTPDADCVSQTFELIDGTEQSGTWRVTYHVSPFIQCAKYNQAIKITDTLGNTTVHTIGGFWFGGSDPPSTCAAGEQYETS